MSKFKYWLPAIVYMALIFWLSSRSVPETLKHFPIIAKLKVVHLIEYGVLYFLCWFAIVRTTAYRRHEAFILALTITVLYGCTDEFHQIFVPQRTARISDIVADGVGGLLTQAGISALRK